MSPRDEVLLGWRAAFGDGKPGWYFDGRGKPGDDVRTAARDSMFCGPRLI